MMSCLRFVGASAFIGFYILTTLKLSEAADCARLDKVNYTATYTPLGNVTVRAGMDTYETGFLNSTKILIAVYDIYGFTPITYNIYQVCDTLGALGYKVVMPDFFHGEPWKREHYPFPNDQEFYDFVKATSWDESVKTDLGLVLEEYKAENAGAEFGLFGFCFGGKIAAHAVGEYYDDIKVAAQFHPAGANISDAELIRRPSLLMPGANDPDMMEYCALINKNLGAGSCVYNHFRDVNHGYSGGTADWTNATIRGRAEEAIGLFEQFLCDKFPVYLNCFG